MASKAFLVLTLLLASALLFSSLAVAVSSQRRLPQWTLQRRVRRRKAWRTQGTTNTTVDIREADMVDIQAEDTMEDIQEEGMADIHVAAMEDILGAAAMAATRVVAMEDTLEAAAMVATLEVAMVVDTLVMVVTLERTHIYMFVIDLYIV
ncbi:hypothetical protein QJS10_CPA10g01891 [Acorus calamus]|uniref:Uncharacterized protein n=1 Tax=Acorus calamus TaxID=4465 RepID=A0AAV9E039_ACOCL|nr:hypothetical protein QJS10_CPA10g01891 [Acorus calamus]